MKIETHVPKMWFARIHLKSSCGTYTMWLTGSSLIFALLQTFDAYQNHLENMLQWWWSAVGAEMLVFNKSSQWFGCSWLSDQTWIWPVGVESVHVWVVVMKAREYGTHWIHITALPFLSLDKFVNHLNFEYQFPFSWEKYYYYYHYY